MKFKIDENLPTEVAAALRALGHDADTVPEEGLAGGADPLLLTRVRSEGRAFLTMDKGIADVRRYAPIDYQGILLLRPKFTGRSAVLCLVRQHLSTITSPSIAGRLLVLTEGGLRIR